MPRGRLFPPGIRVLILLYWKKRVLPGSLRASRVAELQEEKWTIDWLIFPDYQDDLGARTMFGMQGTSLKKLAPKSWFLKNCSDPKMQEHKILRIYRN